MAATPKEEKATAPLLPAVQPAPLCTNAPAVQSAVQLNQVAVRQHLDVAAVHSRCGLGEARYALWQEARAEARAVEY